MGYVLCLTLLYATLVEYTVHRWVMHIPGLGRGLWWNEHAILHHKEGRSDVNIGLSPITVCLGLSPWFLACVWYGWPFATWLLAGAICYGAAWSALHAAIHNVGCLWVRQIPGFAIWERHHMKHHEQPFRNYGTIFIWTDWLFLTKAR